jgi:GDP/UDP-N,N'-diacetylbacillosamine 2-epimerase (hydrolysing)
MGIKRRIAVVTGTRAEYGLLVPVMKAIVRDRSVRLDVFVTGMHLLRRFGHTVDEVENDGWNIAARIPLQRATDDIIGQSRGMGRAIEKFSIEFSRRKIDVVVVLGDRIETFAAATAGFASQLIVAHIHGGDASIGVQDDVYRYAITKLAHLHFAATGNAKNRLIRQGEEPFRIYQTGSPGLDDLDEILCSDAAILSEYAGFDVCNDFMVIVQHSAGGTVAQEHRQMADTLTACKHTGLKMLMLYPNSDAGFSGIIEAGRQFCRKVECAFVPNVPRSVYLGLLRRCRVLVGNSSSGIIEASFLGVPCVNIGPRQMGRDRSNNVTDVPYGVTNVADGIRRALRRRGRIRPSRYYGDGRAGPKIAAVLHTVKLDRKLRQKRLLA